MDTYKNKSREELLNICKDKFINGRTYDELAIFLNRHDVDKDTQRYIFDELENYEKELKDNPPKKKQIPFTPMNMIIGVALITLGLIVLLIGNMRGRLYYMALFIALVGIALIGIEVVKVFFNFFREKKQ